MNADQILTDVFADQAELRPDAGEVMANVQQRLADGPRMPVGRVAAAVSAAAAVAVTAVVGVAVAGRGSTPHSPHRVAALGSTGTPSDSSAPTTTTPVVPLSSAPNGYSTIAAGWLPGPARQVAASNQPGFEQRDYDVTVNGVDMDVIIYVESGSQLPSGTEAGSSYHDVTINGYPGREFVADNATIVAFDLGNGRIAYAGPSVVATSTTVTTALISDIALHVAREIQFNQHDPIPANEGNDVTRVPN